MNLAHDNQLRQMINERIEKVFTYQRRLIEDAAERKMIISKSRLSKYLKGNSGGITEEQILWVATRLGVFINVGYGKPVLNNGKLSYELTPYSELESIRRLKKIFPDNKQAVKTKEVKKKKNG